MNIFGHTIKIKFEDNIDNKNKHNHILKLSLLTFAVMSACLIILNDNVSKKNNNNLHKDSKIKNNTDNNKQQLLKYIDSYISALLNKAGFDNDSKNIDIMKQKLAELLLSHIYHSIAANLPSEKELKLFYIMINENIDEEHIYNFAKKYIPDIDILIEDSIIEFENKFLQESQKRLFIQEKIKLKNI